MRLVAQASQPSRHTITLNAREPLPRCHDDCRVRGLAWPENIGRHDRAMCREQVRNVPLRVQPSRVAGGVVKSFTVPFLFAAHVRLRDRQSALPCTIQTHGNVTRSGQGPLECDPIR